MLGRSLYPSWYLMYVGLLLFCQKARLCVSSFTFQGEFAFLDLLQGSFCFPDVTAEFALNLQ